MTTSIIRSTLWGLYYRRKHTIQRLREDGRCMRTECEALEALKVQLEVSKHWTLAQHIAMVVGMRMKIVLLVKVTFRKDNTFQNKVLDLLIDCQNTIQQPTLFS